MDYDELITRINPSEEGSDNLKVTLNLRTTYNNVDKTERTSEVPPNNDLQFITITDPSQSQIPKNKKIVRSQAMRYARNRGRSFPHENQSSLHLGASRPPVLKAHCAHIQPPGSATCSCTLPNGVCRNKDCHEASSTDLVGAAAWYSRPVSVLGSGRVDPFGIFPVEMSPYMNFLFDYYDQIAGQVQLFDAGSISTLSATLIPLAISSEAILQGLLCVAGSRVTVESGGQTPRPWEIYHRGEAIRLITAGLSDHAHAISDETITAIILICGYDVLFGHYEDLETHMKGVERIVTVRGGLDKLGYNGVLRVLVSWANHFRKKPKKTRLPKTSGLAPSQPADVQIQPHVSWFMDSTGPLVPSGFRKITLKGLISLGVFQSINTLCSVFNERTPSSPAEAVKFNDRIRNMEQNLNDVLHGSSKTVIEECCVLAILICEHFTLIALTPWAYPLFALSRDLKKTLDQSELSLYWSGEVNLLLWILFIGYLSSHMPAQKTWFARVIQGLALNTNHKLDFNELKSILRDFLYSETLFESPYMDLWTWLGENS